MDRKEILLLATLAAGDSGLTPVQLQKSLFLIGESKLQGVPDTYYKFIPYNYGPFDAAIYAEADELSAAGHIAQNPVQGRSWTIYNVTVAGENSAQQIKSTCPGDLAEYIKSVVDWTKSLSFSGLLRSIYAAYPQFRENSVFQQ
jgi:hypothetical protein